MIRTDTLAAYDPEVAEAVRGETEREQTHIELIASENFVSRAVLEAQGSIMTNKYAEGYPGHRYYGGCAYVDEVENLARERLKKLFGAAYVNVQPHSGSEANLAVYRTLLNLGDKVLGMALDHGGHLTHGSPLSFSGQDYDCHFYGLDPETETIDYESVRSLALELRPRLIIAGASAYPRAIDFARFRQIADEVGAWLFVDMAHIAGLVAAGLHQNPVPYAHVVTSTTHKTLRGPRGGIILSSDPKLGKKLDKAVFPGVQGGPLMHVIAAKAVAFKEAGEPEFQEYQKRVVANAACLADALIRRGYHVVSGGTDNHLLLVDVKKSLGLTGREAERLLDSVNITVNKNTVPGDPEKPFITSGIRLGTPAVTSRGFGLTEIEKTAALIDRALRHPSDRFVLDSVKDEVLGLTASFPLPY